MSEGLEGKAGRQKDEKRERKSRGKTLRTHTHRERDDTEISTQAHRKMGNVEHMHRHIYTHFMRVRDRETKHLADD